MPRGSARSCRRARRRFNRSRSAIWTATATPTPSSGSPPAACGSGGTRAGIGTGLFTWNGTRFEFVTDFMGGGEMGDWVAPSMWNRPDPDEYVRIRGDQLQPRDGRYEIRVTNELEEAMFVDRLQLVAVDHPAGVEV